MTTFQVEAASAELALMCDVTLGAALKQAIDAYRNSTGVRIQLFPTAPGLIVPMLARHTLIDIVVTRLATLGQVDKAGLLASGPKSPMWRDPLVVAEGPATNDKFAVSELPGSSGIDAGAALAILDIPPARIASAIDTEEVAFLLTTGAARSGLLYRTDAKAHPSLRVVRTLTDPPPAVFAAGVNKGSGRPNPAGFIAFLASPPIRTILTSNGLEAEA